MVRFCVCTHLCTPLCVQDGAQCVQKCVLKTKTKLLLPRKLRGKRDIMSEKEPEDRVITDGYAKAGTNQLARGSSYIPEYHPGYAATLTDTARRAWDAEAPIDFFKKSGTYTNGLIRLKEEAEIVKKIWLKVFHI